jgi:hypothetical protein
MIRAPETLATLELRLRRVFVAGLSASAISLALGLGMYFVAPDATSTSYLLRAGLIVLMATPFLRVVVSIGEYVRLRDWVFTALTIAVLAELMVTMIYALQQR